MGNTVSKPGDVFPPVGTTAKFSARTRAYKLKGQTIWNYVNGANAASIKAAKGAGTHFCVWEFQANGTWLQTKECECTKQAAPVDSSTPMPEGMQVMIEC